MRGKDGDGEKKKRREKKDVNREKREGEGKREGNYQYHERKAAEAAVLSGMRLRADFRRLRGAWCLGNFGTWHWHMIFILLPMKAKTAPLASSLP